MTTLIIKMKTSNFKLPVWFWALGFGLLMLGDRAWAAGPPYAPASQSEVNAGTNSWKAVTPATLAVVLSGVTGPTNGITATTATNIAAALDVGLSNNIMANITVGKILTNGGTAGQVATVGTGGSVIWSNAPNVFSRITSGYYFSSITVTGAPSDSQNDNGIFTDDGSGLRLTNSSLSAGSYIQFIPTNNSDSGFDAGWILFDISGDAEYESTNPPTYLQAWKTLGASDPAPVGQLAGATIFGNVTLPVGIFTGSGSGLSGIPSSGVNFTGDQTNVFKYAATNWIATTNIVGWHSNYFNREYYGTNTAGLALQTNGVTVSAATATLNFTNGQNTTLSVTSNGTQVVTAQVNITGTLTNNTSGNAATATITTNIVAGAVATNFTFTSSLVTNAVTTNGTGTATSLWDMSNTGVALQMVFITNQTTLKIIPTNEVGEFNGSLDVWFTAGTNTAVQITNAYHWLGTATGTNTITNSCMISIFRGGNAAQSMITIQQVTQSEKHPPFSFSFSFCFLQ